MTSHQWIGHEENCSQLGMEMFYECPVCGLSRGDGFVYAGMLGDYSATPHFSFDCDVAQKELRMYLQGRLDGLSRALRAENDPDGVSMVNLVRTALEGGDVPMLKILPVFKVIEEMRAKRPWHEDVRALLYGRPSSGPPLPPLEDVEL